jgi:cell division protein ZapA (FtsZ GTPase activity inhibitor)
MGSLLRNIRQRLLASGRLRQYLPYALGEIVLVVIGILIALEINNLNEDRIRRHQEADVYQSIRQQVTEDQRELEGVLSFNRYLTRTHEQANAIISARDTSKTDSLAVMAMLLSQYSDFHRDARIYGNLAVSGQLGLLQNPEIPRALQNLELTYTLVNKLEDLHWDIIINELSPELRSVVNYNTLRAAKPERLFGLELQNIVVESIYLTKIKDSIYRRAIAEIESLQGLIDRQLAD